MIRLLCAGVGGMGGADANEALKTGDFKAVGGVDVNEAVRKRFGEERKCPVFADFRTALATVKADAALVGVPDMFHAPYTLAALEAGLDVICEKPMAATLRDARRMHETARRRRRLLMIHHQLRWLPPYYRAHALIEAGAIGTPQHVEFDMSVFSNVCLEGYRSKLPQLMLKDLGIHHLDLIRYLTGATCRRVMARSWISNQERLAIPTTTHTCAILEMKGPITASYRATMRSITDQTGYCCHAAVTGSKGTLIITGEALTVQTFAAHAAGKPPQPISLKAGNRSCWQDFARAIRTRKPALTDSGDNIQSMELLYAAIQSAKTGRIVSMR